MGQPNTKTHATSSETRPLMTDRKLKHNSRIRRRAECTALFFQRWQGKRSGHQPCLACHLSSILRPEFGSPERKFVLLSGDRDFASSLVKTISRNDGLNFPVRVWSWTGSLANVYWHLQHEYPNVSISCLDNPNHQNDLFDRLGTWFQREFHGGRKKTEELGGMVLLNGWKRRDAIREYQDTLAIPFWNRRCGGYYLGSREDLLIVPALKRGDKPVRLTDGTDTKQYLHEVEENLVGTVGLEITSYSQYLSRFRNPSATEKELQEEERSRKWCKYGECCPDGGRCTYYHARAEKDVFDKRPRNRGYRAKVKRCTKKYCGGGERCRDAHEEEDLICGHCRGRYWSRTVDGPLPR